MTHEWLERHRQNRNYTALEDPILVPGREDDPADMPMSPLLSDQAFNNHAFNDGSHVSPYDTGIVQVGTDGLEVRLLQGIDLASLKQVLARATRATTGLAAPSPPNQKWGLQSQWETIPDADWQEMFKGGLQAALESQTIVFEVWGASRALTHQLVRSRRAGFHQQSQRATWYGDRPEVRMPESIWRARADVRHMWLRAVDAAWNAYSLACESGVSYQDARYILPEGTVNYIQCEYTIREFIAVYAYRGCSMFLWEMVDCMRKMRDALLENSPWMKPYVKVSCEKGVDCEECDGRGTITISGIEEPCTVCNGIGSNRKCTFQGWENVELACDFPQAKQSNRVFLPDPKFRIGA